MKAFRFKKECEEDAKQDAESKLGLSVSVFSSVLLFIFLNGRQGTGTLKCARGKRA